MSVLARCDGLRQRGPATPDVRCSPGTVSPHQARPVRPTRKPTAVAERSHPAKLLARQLARAAASTSQPLRVAGCARAGRRLRQSRAARRSTRNRRVSSRFMALSHRIMTVFRRTRSNRQSSRHSTTSHRRSRLPHRRRSPVSRAPRPRHRPARPPEQPTQEPSNEPDSQQDQNASRDNYRCLNTASTIKYFASKGAVMIELVDGTDCNNCDFEKPRENPNDCNSSYATGVAIRPATPGAEGGLESIMIIYTQHARASGLGSGVAILSAGTPEQLHQFPARIAQGAEDAAKMWDEIVCHARASQIRSPSDLSKTVYDRLVENRDSNFQQFLCHFWGAPKRSGTGPEVFPRSHGTSNGPGLQKVQLNLCSNATRATDQ